MALAVACFSLIMAQPRSDPAPAVSSQPLSAPSPALNITDEKDLRDLIAAFPVPVMSFLSGSGLRFVSATSSYAAWGSGFARIATLYWQTADGEPLILRSIYPSEAYSLLEKNFHFTPVAGPTLFGNASVRMEGGGVIRIHTVTGSGLYAVNCPQSLSGQISVISRSLQLFTVDEPAG
ncbi:MAG: hypothetical protein J6U01_12050 [Clostridia bacterium]|nr:hypothetical protein [Clostridia bacterium]